MSTADAPRPGRHRDVSSMVAERYGRHSQANAGGPSATDLLGRAVAAGEAIRLAWRDDNVDETHAPGDFPTAVLPVIRPPREDDPSPKNTEPTTTQGTRPRPDGFSVWPKALAG